jgi:hypothetical protein
MKTMTFRFNTEAEVTLSGDCYEAMHMQFLSFIHREKEALSDAKITITPPHDSLLHLSVDHSPCHLVEDVKGDFKHDILPHMPIMKDKSLLLKDWHFHVQ